MASLRVWSTTSTPGDVAGERAIIDWKIWNGVDVLHICMDETVNNYTGAMNVMFEGNGQILDREETHVRLQGKIDPRVSPDQTSLGDLHDIRGRVDTRRAQR